MKLPWKDRMRQGLQVAGEPDSLLGLAPAAGATEAPEAMKRIWGLMGLALVAISLGACVRGGPQAPRAALEACRSPRALLAVRRAAFQQAASRGATAELLARLRRDGRAVLDDPQVGGYDRDTGVVDCLATLRIEPPGAEGQELSSSITYDATPQESGAGYRYTLTDAGEMVTAIVSLGPPPPATPAAPTAPRPRRARPLRQDSAWTLQARTPTMAA